MSSATKNKWYISKTRAVVIIFLIILMVAMIITFIFNFDFPKYYDRQWMLGKTRVEIAETYGEFAKFNVLDCYYLKAEADMSDAQDVAFYVINKPKLSGLGYYIKILIIGFDDRGLAYDTYLYGGYSYMPYST